MRRIASPLLLLTEAGAVDIELTSSFNFPFTAKLLIHGLHPLPISLLDTLGIFSPLALVNYFLNDCPWSPSRQIKEPFIILNLLNLSGLRGTATDKPWLPKVLLLLRAFPFFSFLFFSFFLFLYILCISERQGTMFNFTSCNAYLAKNIIDAL